MTVSKKTGFPAWHLRRNSPVIDLPHLLSNIDDAIQRKDFTHKDYYSFLESQKILLKKIRKISKANWKEYLGKKASKYWKKLTKRQQKQLEKKTLQIGSKVMVKNISKSGISANKLEAKKTGPWTVIARAVNNNAYKVRHDRTGYTDYIGLRRIRVIPTQESMSNSNSNNDIPVSSLADA